MKHKTIDIKNFDHNIFKLIDDNWGLITVCDNTKRNRKVNIMTASWLTFGILWNKPVSFIFVRPTRYTYNLIENEDFFSISFFSEKYKKVLQFCGTQSGYEIDKLEKCSLTLKYYKYFFKENSNNNNISNSTDKDLYIIPYIEEANISFLCKKIYFQKLNPLNFLDKNIHKHYNNDYHKMYIGEIVTILKK